MTDPKVLALVPLSMDDIGAMRQLYLWQRLEPDRDRFCFVNAPRGVLPVTEEDFAAFRETMADRLEEAEYFILAAPDGSRLGYLTLDGFNPRNRSAEVSYYLPAEHRGRGLGSRMLDLLLAEAFRDTRMPWINRIWAETGAFNAASARLLEGKGFHLDGRIREHYWLDGERYEQLVYTLLRSEYPVKG